MDQGQGTLEVTRRRVAWMDRARAYRLYLDGQELAKLKNGAVFSGLVPAGWHTIQMKIDWLTSSPLQFYVGPEQKVRFGCGPGATPFNVLFKIYRNDTDYIRLWQYAE